ncbi:MAG TPA: methyltransferase [Steroidobacteraceae bacterium]|nr:methyltransferase [Steroidobacteraceae bacterium]
MISAADSARAQELLRLINSSWIAQACYVTARLEIADLLAQGPRSAAELAASTRTHAPSLRRLLQALASIDLCRERDDGRFELTALGSLLRKDSPCSMRAWALKWGGDDWLVWANLLHSIRTGESARTLITGTPGFAHLDRDPQAAAIFNQAMADLTRLTAVAVAQAYDFSGARVMDVGGGYGELLVHILARYPTATGVIFDMDHAMEKARAHLRASGLEGRCEFLSGDFFKEIPGGADVYAMKSIIHDWPDERARVILENCRRALKPGARLLVIERLMPARMVPSADHEALARSDLHMLVALAAQERTRGAMEQLLRSAGFTALKHIDTGADFHVIEARN